MTRMAADIRGCGTALVTPFHRDGSIDEPALRRLVQRQLEGGADFLATCGATGEEATLDECECDRVMAIAVEEAAGRVPVVGSVCGNDTRKMIGRVRGLDRLGIDAVLCVAPYYTIPTQEGIAEHFETLAQHSAVPIVLYNVPGRTVVNMQPSTIARLADHPNILGIKEASSNLIQLTDLLLKVPPSFRVFAGYDCFAFPLLCLGAAGVISPTANLVPAHMTRLVRLALEGRYAEARQLHASLWWLIRAVYMEVNPLPVKAALAMMGLIGEHYRLPLSPMKPALRARLEETLAAHGLLVTTQPHA